MGDGYPVLAVRYGIQVKSYFAEPKIQRRSLAPQQTYRHPGDSTGQVENLTH